MTIKIKRVFIEKDSSETQNKETMRFLGIEKLKGKFKVQLTGGKVYGNAEVKMEDISVKLQDELYDVLGRIEDELNGIAVEELVDSNNVEAKKEKQEEEEESDQSSVDEFKHAWKNLNINETVAQNITVSLTVNNKEDMNKFVSEITKGLKKQKGSR